MTQGTREGCKSGIVDISILISLHHVHITSADTAGLHFDQNLSRTRNRYFLLHDFKIWVSPDLAAQIGKFTVNVFNSQFKFWFRVPFSEQGYSFHQ